MSSFHEVVEQFQDITTKHTKLANDIRKLREEGEFTSDNTSNIKESYRKFKKAVNSFQVPELKRGLDTNSAGFCFAVGILRSFKNLVPYFACNVELARAFLLP